MREKINPIRIPNPPIKSLLNVLDASHFVAPGEGISRVSQINKPQITQVRNEIVGRRRSERVATFFFFLAGDIIEISKKDPRFSDAVMNLIDQIPEIRLLNGLTGTIDTSKVPSGGIGVMDDFSIDEVVIEGSDGEVYVIIPSENQATSQASGRNMRDIRERARGESIRNSRGERF